MLTFKTLAEFKRAISVGMRFECTHLVRREVSGPREISRVQGNALACWRLTPTGERMPGDENWCHFPNAKLVVIDQVIAKGSRISFADPTGRVVFTYHSFQEVSRVG